MELIRGEIRDQLRQMGVATEEEVNALRKRVRDLERTSRATGARGGKKPAAKAKAAAAQARRAKKPPAEKTDTAEA